MKTPRAAAVTTAYRVLYGVARTGRPEPGGHRATLIGMPLPSAALARALAPEGLLRASINLGNPVLAHRDARTGEAGGAPVDLARALGHELNLDVGLVLFDRAAQSVDAVRGGQADVGFFAVDPARGEGLCFTAPYVLIEGSYLVAQEVPLRANAEVDRRGTRVAVGEGSAYDLFLSRELRVAGASGVAGRPRRWRR